MLHVSISVSLKTITFCRNSDNFTEEFVDQIHAEEGTTAAGNVRRVDMIRQKLRDFYLVKCKYDLEATLMPSVLSTEMGKTAFFKWNNLIF
jgi:hypothetical protein